MMTKTSKNYGSFFAILVIVFSLFANNAFSQNTNRIKVIGNQRIDAKTVKSYLNTRNLATGQLRHINKAVKKLYDLDLFSQVDIYKKQSTIIIEVKENPIVKEVVFKGNKKIDDDILASEVRLKKRAIYTKAKLESDIKRINDIYIKTGRFLANIDPKVKKEDQNRISVIFDISEGKKASIKDINFIGNRAFRDQDLLDEITTKKTKWYKPFSSSDSYDSDRMEFDKEKLRRFYNSQGYADFNVVSANAQITPLKDRFFINFLIEEGVKYKFGEVKINNDVDKFDESLLNKVSLIEKGKTYNADLVDKTMDEYTEILSNNGYAFTKIIPNLEKNKETRIIDIKYVIKETPRIYINEINITGNSRTLDKVIRREMRVREGDPYNFNKINRSKQRINNLGFFESVDIKTNRIGNSDKVNLEVEVKEKKTGELNFGIGYSTVDQATANIGIKEKNLFGTGQEIALNVQKSTNRFSNQINYTKPWFMGREVSVGFDVFNSELDSQNTLAFDQEIKGLAVRAGYAISEHLNHLVRYSFRDEEISDVNEDASQALKNLEGSFVSSAISHTLTYDKRNNRFNPSEGYFAQITQTYSGIGGDLDFLKHEGNASYYLPIKDDKFVLKFSGRFGHIVGLGQDIRSNNNFFLGGNNFRGFEFAGIGPRTVNNGSAVGGDAIGGRVYYMNTTEFKFPLGLPKELGISAALFHDIGTLKEADAINKVGTQVVDTGSLRASFGLSIIWTSPLGPIRLDFSNAYKAEDFDQTESFRFSFGTTF